MSALRPQRALLAACLALAAAVPLGCDKASPSTPPRNYTFRMRGDEADLPWNRTLYFTYTAKDKTPERAAGIYFAPDQDGGTIAQVPGTRWRATSDDTPSPAMRRLLWMVDQSGTFGDDTSIDINVPKRPSVAIVSDPEHPTDWITVADPASGARLAVARDEVVGQRWGLWDRTPTATAVKVAGVAAEDWRGQLDNAKPRPWVWRESAPGSFVIAAKTGERRWLVQRVELKTGETTTLDPSHEPKGGGHVVCEDVRAELLINGELPLPAMRLSDLQFRAEWSNLPDGHHVLAYTDGRRVPFDCTDKTDLTFGK